MEDKIQIILEAVENAKAQIDQAINDIGRLNNANEQSVKTREKHAESLRHEAGEMIATAVETLALYEALKKLIEVSIELPVQIEQMAAAAGASISQFDALSKAAQKFEVDASQLSIAMKNLGVATAEALSGNDKRIAEFKSLGISTQFLRDNQNDLLKIFLRVSDTFKNHADGVNKAYIAQQLFGRSSQALIAFMDQGSGSINEQTDALKKLGVLTEADYERTKEFRSAMIEFNTVLQSAVREVVHGMLPAITELLKSLTETPERLKAVALAVAILTEAVVVGTTKLGPYIAALQTLLSLTALYKAINESDDAKNTQRVSEISLVNGQLARQKQLLADVLKAQEEGKIGFEEAGRLDDLLVDTIINKIGNDAVAAQKQLDEVTKSLRAANGLSVNREEAKPEEKPQLPGVPDSSLAKARAEAALQIQQSMLDKSLAKNKATIEIEQAQNDASLRERAISLEEWTNRAISLERRRIADEKANALALRDAERDANKKAQQETSDPKEIAKLRAQHLADENAFQKKIVELDAEAARRKIQIEQEVAQKARELMGERISEVQSAESTALANFQGRLDDIFVGESKGKFTNAFEEITKAQSDYTSELKKQQTALLKILETIKEINQQHPGTFTDAYAKNIGKAVADNEKNQVEAEKRTTAAKQQLFDKQLQGVQGMFGNMATAAKAFGKEGFAAYKAFAIAQATIDTAKAAIAAYQSVVGIPYVGPILAPIAAGAAVAAGAAQIASIEGQSFEEGGLVPGAVSHKDNTLAMVASGEYIFDSESVSKVGASKMAALHRSIRSGNISFHDSGGIVSSTAQARGARSGSAGVSSGAGLSSKVNVGFIETRNHLRRFMREDGTNILIEQLQSRGNQVSS